MAKTLRKNMTKEEKHLWYDFLRDYPVKFYRQRILGAYIVDFYCSKAMLVIELDGSQHYTTDKAELNDKLRTDYLVNRGVKVLRFTNREIKENFSGVCETIHQYVSARLSDM
ncbi:endonuclease domain-containing protein [Ruminococcus sp.]|uniref:endonuclease domain-containing protein n=1 Tax=Ruminococcus sp. TaxID=41978 RepID=UPI003867BA83